ncbi:MAG: hypothetical protein WCT12_20840 [Verrucomicrobiota bacterium]
MNDIRNENNIEHFNSRLNLTRAASSTAAAPRTKSLLFHIGKATEAACLFLERGGGQMNIMKLVRGYMSDRYGAVPFVPAGLLGTFQAHETPGKTEKKSHE